MGWGRGGADDSPGAVAVADWLCTHASIRSLLCEFYLSEASSEKCQGYFSFGSSCLQGKRPTEWGWSFCLYGTYHPPTSARPGPIFTGLFQKSHTSTCRARSVSHLRLALISLTVTKPFFWSKEEWGVKSVLSFRTQHLPRDNQWNRTGGGTTLGTHLRQHSKKNA